MRQRVMIAIALACDPDLLIADEPTTALDVTIQAQILELLHRLSKERGMAVLLITHDLGIVAGLCDRVLVMYAGEIIEKGTTDQIFYSPQHPYTRALLEAVPRLGQNHHQRLVPIVGAPPSLLHPPVGCAFTDRCRWAMRVCRLHHPTLDTVKDNQEAACWLHHPEAKKVMQ
jgi:oligopeptide transport system ATP-binding protein